MVTGQSPIWLSWVFGCWCLSAMASDLLGRRIPNWLTYPAILMGLVMGYIVRGPEGLLDALAGILVVLPFVFLFFARMFGGGDVKFLAGIGAWLGLFATLNVALSAVLLGAAMGAISLIWQGRLLDALRRESREIFAVVGRKQVKALDSQQAQGTHRDRFPFGVPLGLSALFWMGPVLG